MVGYLDEQRKKKEGMKGMMKEYIVRYARLMMAICQSLNSPNPLPSSTWVVFSVVGDEDSWWLVSSFSCR